MRNWEEWHGNEGDKEEMSEIRWGRGQKVGPIDRGVRRSIYVFA